MSSHTTGGVKTCGDDADAGGKARYKSQFLLKKRRAVSGRAVEVVQGRHLKIPLDELRGEETNSG